ncbi:PREDICTED: uncharacterized protein LOC104587377 [Nelumbo nucifera]|uniref:Uncharacterized protein LOC104587377 n=1 Tax=Nelumbo nucifera TaxID=4432 RepID=A0A1U7YVE4_NELNU|nr:PREDICTED: uncharacterized protein LOC104587377 [Nelumbo nucifera]
MLLVTPYGLTSPITTPAEPTQDSSNFASSLLVSHEPTTSTPPSPPLGPTAAPTTESDTETPHRKMLPLEDVLRRAPIDPSGFVSRRTRHRLPEALVAEVASIGPTSYTAAKKYLEWQQTMQSEYDALIRNGTWSLVPVPPNANIVGCKWIFKLKRNSDGSLAHYKARLVARGFTQ